ncbi:MAG: DUF4058 family protein [Planctomycetota bacterium]
MPSPFPGMNPYLEQPTVWQDFHHSLITRVSEALSGQMRPDFFVKIGVSVFVHEPNGEERNKTQGRPDIMVIERARGGGVAVMEPRAGNISALIASISDVDVEKHSYIEIRDRANRELVTMIEVLSPSNKHYGPDREQYLMKRTALLCSPVSVVEIDLLRDGPRLPLTGVPGCDYSLMVSRPAMRPNVQAWAVKLHDPLPTIPIPLRGSAPDASLNLQTLLHEVYDAAGYEDYLYHTPPEPPLPEADAEWARQFVSAMAE